jgi:hypothetical protein
MELNNKKLCPLYNIVDIPVINIKYRNKNDFVIWVDIIICNGPVINTSTKRIVFVSIYTILKNYFRKVFY